MPGELESAGLFPFVEGAGFGRGSFEVDRFASSSVAGGVETGAVGALLTIGFRPAQPAIPITNNNRYKEKKSRFCGHAFPGRTLKRNPLSRRLRAPLGVFPAILRLLPVSRTLLAGIPRSFFLFPAPHLPKQTVSPPPVSRPLAFQNLRNCQCSAASKLPRRCAYRTLRICSSVTSSLL